MSIRQKQVKSSRLFLGHIHDVNIEYISRHFGVRNDFYKTIKTTDQKLFRLLKNNKHCFFINGIPGDYVDKAVDLVQFLTFDEAYHHLVYDLVDICLESLNLILPSGDQTKKIYITGGFARNELFTRILAGKLPDKRIYTSEMDNATALGAAMVVWDAAFVGRKPATDLGLKEISNK